MSEWISVKDRLPEKVIPVMCYGINSYGKGRTLRGMYIPEKAVEADSENECSEYDESTDEYWELPGWVERNEYDETNWYIEHEVTHWMPLPEAP